MSNPEISLSVDIPGAMRLGPFHPFVVISGERFSVHVRIETRGRRLAGRELRVRVDYRGGPYYERVTVPDEVDAAVTVSFPSLPTLGYSEVIHLPVSVEAIGDPEGTTPVAVTAIVEGYK